MTTQEIRTEFIEANGHRFEVLACGEGDALALCLHGFPEVALSWREQMIRLPAWAIGRGRRTSVGMAGVVATA